MDVQQHVIDINHTIKQISQNGCTIITPELEGFKRPNWAQIEADLCVSDMGGLVFRFDHRVAQK